MNDSSGPGWLTPSTPPSQPHWCTATVAPKAAPTESRNPTVATTGTTIERNTSIRMTSESPTTTTR